MVEFCQGFLNPEQADFLQRYSEKQVYKETVYSSGIKMPRLTRWVGDAGAAYTYSGQKNEPEPWDKVLWRLKLLAEKETSTRYNSVLVNYYRNGKDSVGYHSDDEPELGPMPSIFSISVGETRKFLMKSKENQQVTTFLLTHGSSIFMDGYCQQQFQHSVPKDSTIKPRWNYTFRMIR